MIKRLNKAKKKDFELLELSLMPEHGDWRRATANDSATWKQAWVPGGPAATSVAPLAIPSMPYFVVCDSAGIQLCRTPYVAVAEQTVNDIFKN